MHGFARSLVLVAASFPSAALAQDAGKAPPPPVPDLVLKLSAKDAAARRDACIALKTRWPDAARAVPALIEVADDDESADVKKAAVETLGALGNEGGKTFAAWVNGVSPQEKEEMAGFFGSVRELGPAVTPADFQSACAQGFGWGRVVAALHDSDRGEWMSPGAAVPTLESKHARARAAAAATLGACARTAATRHGAPVPSGSVWTSTAAALADGAWEEGRWLGMGLLVRAIPTEPQGRERLLAAANEPWMPPGHYILAALARGGPVPAGKAADFARFCASIEVLEYGRRLGLLEAAARSWLAAEGELAPAMRWLGGAVESKDPAVVALLRRAERDPWGSELGTWANPVLRLAGIAKSADLAPLLAFAPSARPLDREAPPGGEITDAWAAEVRCVAVLAILDATPRDSAATKALAEALTSADLGTRRVACRTFAALAPGAVELPADALRAAEESEYDDLLVASRRGADPVHAVPRLVEIAMQCRQGDLISGKVPQHAHPHVYRELVTVLRTLGKFGRSAVAALPELKQHLTSPDEHIAHVARTAIRRIEAK